MSAAPDAAWPPMPDDVAGLWGPDFIAVWQSPTDLPPAAHERLAALLSPVERQRLARYRAPGKQREGTVARGLLRFLLGRLLQINPHQLNFPTGNHGKPSLAGTWRNCTVDFNISHTHNKVLIAIAANRQIGVDVEYIRPQLAFAELAQRFFAPVEYAAIMRQPPDAQRAAFFACWTRKEAILKASGLGIAGGLTSFEVSVLPLAPPATISIAGQGDSWHLHDLPLPANYIAALAFTAPSAPIHQWSLPAESFGPEPTPDQWR